MGSVLNDPLLSSIICHVEKNVYLCNGMKNDGSFGTIDNLAISYDGNRLLKVTDNAEAVNYNGSLDFHDGAKVGF